MTCVAGEKTDIASVKRFARYFSKESLEIRGKVGTQPAQPMYPVPLGSATPSCSRYLLSYLATARGDHATLSQQKHCSLPQ